jgi:hypothetical protein
MRVVATLADNRIVQVEKNPPNGEGVARNGMYMMPIAEGVKVTVDSSSVVLPTGSPNSIVARNFAGLLAQFPQFEHILFNPLIEAADVDDLDPAAVLNEGAPVVESYGSRFQIGRGTGGPLAPGNAANSVAVLASNDTAGAGNERPGVLVSDTIDVGPLTSNLGATEFAVYWYIYEFETSIDVRSSFGLHAGQNTASVRRALELDQEPDDFEVWFSINDGANFVQVQRLVPVSFCTSGTLARIAFKNLNPLRKRYVAHYALLF